MTRSTFPAPVGSRARIFVLGMPLEDTVTGYAVRTYGSAGWTTDVPCYILDKAGAWPCHDCEVLR